MNLPKVVLTPVEQAEFNAKMEVKEFDDSISGNIKQVALDVLNGVLTVKDFNGEMSKPQLDEWALRVIAGKTIDAYIVPLVKLSPKVVKGCDQKIITTQVKASIAPIAKQIGTGRL
jgi:hypothetical protein